MSNEIFLKLDILPLSSGLTIVFCYINLSNLVWKKRFDTIIFRFPGVSSLKNENRVTILHPRRSRGGKSVTRFSIFQTRWLRENGKFIVEKPFLTANLTNEYNRMLFLIFRFPHMCGKWAVFRTPVRKMSEKNKMDNSQNGYSSVEKTGKIKKNSFSFMQKIKALAYLSALPYGCCFWNSH